jgi:hypothetical protein
MARVGIRAAGIGATCVVHLLTLPVHAQQNFGKWTLVQPPGAQPKATLSSFPVYAGVAGVELFCAGGRNLGIKVTLKKGTPGRLLLSIGSATQLSVATATGTKRASSSGAIDSSPIRTCRRHE